MTNVQLEAQQFCDIVIYNPERATAVKRRPYPGVYNAGPVVNADAFVRDLLDDSEHCANGSTTASWWPCQLVFCAKLPVCHLTVHHLIGYDNMAHSSLAKSSYQTALQALCKDNQ